MSQHGQRPKPSGKPLRHPYAAIEHRVIDSEAYAALSFSARALLVMLTRQLSKDNNGRLQATFSYMKRFGFASEHTLSRAIAELIAHGMIYRTRSGGYQQGAAQYAVTWLPITKLRDGLYLDGFRPCAWRDWTPSEKKSPPPKMQDTHCKKCSLTGTPTAKNAASRGAKNADNELMPCSSAKAAIQSSGNWIPAYLARLEARGLAGRQCFRAPSAKSIH